MKNTFEWDIETIDPDTGDILDHHHENALACYPRGELLAALDNTDPTRWLVLVRDRYDANNGVVDREWAYITFGELPDTFDGGSAVPARFRTEFTKWKV